MYKLSYLSIKKNLYPLTLLDGVRGLQIFITTYSLHTGSYYFLHIVFPKMIITTTSTKIIPNAIYIKNAGKIFSNTPGNTPTQHAESLSNYIFVSIHRESDS